MLDLYLMIRKSSSNKYGMRYSEITEAVRPALLYHGTSAHAAEVILHMGKMEGRTTHNAQRRISSAHPKKLTSTTVPMAPKKYINKYGDIDGVSFSRNAQYPRLLAKDGGVIFVLDEVSVRKTHKIVPVDYYINRSESEEFVIGDITNIDQYIVSILITQDTYNELVAKNEEFEEGQGPYELVVNHPKLKIL